MEGAASFGRLAMRKLGLTVTIPSGTQLTVRDRMANASVEWQLCEDINENTAITNVSVDDGEMILVNLKDKHDGNLRYEALKSAQASSEPGRERRAPAQNDDEPDTEINVVDGDKCINEQVKGALRTLTIRYRNAEFDRSDYEMRLRLVTTEVMRSNIETGLVHTWAYPIVMLALEAMFDTVESLDQALQELRSDRPSLTWLAALGTRYLAEGNGAEPGVYLRTKTATKTIIMAALSNLEQGQDVKVAGYAKKLMTKVQTEEDGPLTVGYVGMSLESVRSRQEAHARGDTGAKLEGPLTLALQRRGTESDVYVLVDKKSLLKIVRRLEKETGTRGNLLVYPVVCTLEALFCRLGGTSLHGTSLGTNVAAGGNGRMTIIEMLRMRHASVRATSTTPEQALQILSTDKVVEVFPSLENWIKSYEGAHINIDSKSLLSMLSKKGGENSVRNRRQKPSATPKYPNQYKQDCGKGGDNCTRDKSNAPAPLGSNFANLHLHDSSRGGQGSAPVGDLRREAVLSAAELAETHFTLKRTRDVDCRDADDPDTEIDMCSFTGHRLPHKNTRNGKRIKTKYAKASDPTNVHRHGCSLYGTDYRYLLDGKPQNTRKFSIV